MASPDEPQGSDVTSQELYLSRREWLRKAGLFSAVSATWAAGLIGLSSRGGADPPPTPPPVPSARGEDGSNPWEVKQGSPLSTDEAATDYGAITTYNNFYELGLSKVAPSRNASLMKLRPWTIEVDGETHKPRTLDIDQLLKDFPLEERVYRMRCVEAWSMVIPWVGFPLASLIKRLEPTSRAKYVAFETLLDPQQLPGQKRDALDWPYREGLRMDEAMHPLTLLAVGIYGAPLLGQSGAPIRLVVPWKYGFKGIKSIVRIRFMERRPATSWSSANGREYGFYANVNPKVDHPRWSQASERRIGNIKRIPTQLFNGYGEQVASLYSGLDLRTNF